MQNEWNPEEFILHSVRIMLQRLGYQVTAYADSREALEASTSDPAQFDLVITNQAMPFMTGENLGKEVLRLRPDIPVMLCTGYADFISSEKAREMDFRGFIMKPFSVREVALVDLAPAEFVKAFAAGKIDAIIAWQPHIHAVGKKSRRWSSGLDRAARRPLASWSEGASGWPNMAMA